MSVVNPIDGCRYEVDSAEDAHYVRTGSIGLAFSARRVEEEPAVVSPAEGVLDPTTGRRYIVNSAEDAYFVRCGRPDLAFGVLCYEPS